MRFSLLGPLVVTDGAGDLVMPAGQRLRVLLAALLLHADMPVPAGALAEMVWDGSPPPAAAETLRSYIRRLRQALGPDAGRIVAGGTGYLIRAAQQELDVLEFEALCRGTRAALRADQWQDASAAASRALRLWRAAPLLDVPAEALRGKFVPPLEQLRLQVLEDSFDAGFRLGEHRELIPRLMDAAAEYPLQERFHAQLMLALANAGRRAQALYAYQEARRVLVGELGIEPGPELRGIQRQILADEGPGNDETGGDVPPGSAEPAVAAGPPELHRLTSRAAAALAVPRQLPGMAAHFTGRAAELAALDGMLDRASGQQPGPVVISAIGGTAGVGKTALAVRWAHQVAARFPDGQLYVNLLGFGPSGTPVSPGHAIQGFLYALGVPADRIPRDLDARAGLYRSLLAGRRILIVLDNARDGQQVRPLLPAWPGCMVLVTSRNQLVGLSAADGARLLNVDVLSHAEARQLFTARLGAERTAAEPDAVAEIIELCARLPLALVIAAARANSRPRLSLSALAAELRDTQGRLGVLDSADPAASVRAVFSWSTERLSPAAARLFRLLGLHPGPDITTPAVASLVGILLRHARQALDELIRAHLLTEQSSGRYAFHDLLRTYAAEQATTTETGATRRAATHRIVSHYLHTAHRGSMVLDPQRDPLTPALPPQGATAEQLTDFDEAMGWFEAEHKNLLAVLTLAAQAGLDAHAWQLAWAMTVFLDWRGHWDDWAAAQRIAIQAADRLGDTAGRVASYRLAASACRNLGNYDEAYSLLGTALDLSRELGDPIIEARIRQHLAVICDYQERPADSLQHCGQALLLFQAAGHRAGQAQTLNNLGWAHTLLGDPQRGRTLCLRALAMCRRVGDRAGEASTWDSLGYAEHQLGRYDKAATCYNRALGLYGELGYRFRAADTLTHLGDTHRTAGDAQGARQAWLQALEIYEDLHLPYADRVRDKLGEVQRGKRQPEPTNGERRPP
jgi:DNA-binding SARP family transcriptional activator/tetratricopeptide (TPR) repeat protein